jgi:hypothetical protein
LILVPNLLRRYPPTPSSHSATSYAIVDIGSVASMDSSATSVGTCSKACDESSINGFDATFSSGWIMNMSHVTYGCILHNSSKTNSLINPWCATTAYVLDWTSISILWSDQQLIQVIQVIKHQYI